MTKNIQNQVEGERAGHEGQEDSQTRRYLLDFSGGFLLRAPVVRCW
jgi:hypothetical protein